MALASAIVAAPLSIVRSICARPAAYLREKHNLASRAARHCDADHTGPSRNPANLLVFQRITAIREIGHSRRRKRAATVAHDRGNIFMTDIYSGAGNEH